MIRPGLLAAGVFLAAATSVSFGLAKPAPPRAAVQAPAPELSAMAKIGAQIFSDPILSSSGRQSCASCHDPAHAFAPANSRAIQLGGPGLDRPGIRAVPSLAYKSFTPAFSQGPESLYEIEGPPPGPITSAKPSAQAKGQPQTVDMTLRGGMDWDGRAETLQEQALGPLLSPFEMDNASAGAVIAQLRRAPYAEGLAALAGQPPGSAASMDGQLLLAEAEFALARFQIEDPRFHAYSSKYDAYLRGQAKLTASEMRGLKLFDDPKKAGCATCHLDKPSADGAPPAFTDYEFEALGVPRNPAIPANADPAFFDLGVCGPLRDDAFSRQAANCGLFKTPTLRNAATRKAFFHNGVYSSLRDVVRFYVLRDAQPEKIYPASTSGVLTVFDDLPAPYRGNIDVLDPPFDRKPGAKPALSDREIDDVTAFIGTLTDGYTPPRL